jgi:hypothetical protein
MTDAPRNMKEGERYLGDGLYASFDGWQVILRAPREHGDHYVALEPEVMMSFRRYLEALYLEYPGHFPSWSAP